MSPTFVIDTDLNPFKVEVAPDGPKYAANEFHLSEETLR